MKTYRIFRQWRTKYWKTVYSEESVWEALSQLPFGEGYEVKDDSNKICLEFIPL